MLSQDEIQQLNADLQQQHPKEILREVLRRIPGMAISFSGAEDVVLIELASKVSKDFSVFTLDTGRLHAQTYRFIDVVRKRYGIEIDIMSPDTEALQKLVKQKGLFSFYEDGHEECCGIRKVEPLRRKLAEVNGWITGQRKDQSPMRNSVNIIELDTSFAGKGDQLVKVNPLANWSSADVWNYIRSFDVPYNELHDKGFVSIGCQPCTRPVGPNQHEREGRWWWEEATIKECGLHRSNLEE